MKVDVEKIIRWGTILAIVLHGTAYFLMAVVFKTPPLYRHYYLFSIPGSLLIIWGPIALIKEGHNKFALFTLGYSLVVGAGLCYAAVSR